MGIEVSEDKSIGVWVSEESVEIRSVVRRTGGNRRDVDVVDIERRIVGGDGDGEDFEVWIAVGDRRGVQRGEFNVMVDEDGEAATATAIWSIPAKKRVVAEARVVVRGTEFRFLQASHPDIVFDKVGFKFAFGAVDGVDVEL